MPAPLRIDPPSMREEQIPPAECAELPLIHELHAALERHGVPCCQWKGHWKRHRWGRGVGDIDLLVAYRDLGRFNDTILSLGFRRVIGHPARELPGARSYFGLDTETGKLAHVHVHDRVVLGHPWNTVYELPLAGSLLTSSVAGPVFRVPAPELELILFVLRMTLRHSLRGLVLPRRREWKQALEEELKYLLGRADDSRVSHALREHLPEMEAGIYFDCLRALDPRSPPREGIEAKARLRNALAGSVRKPSASALWTVAADRLRALAYRRPPPTRGRVEGRGLLLALVGGDGAGKTTCARELHSWLSRAVGTLHLHLGRPPRSLTTVMVGGVLKASRLAHLLLGREPREDALISLARRLCTARDRCRLWTRAARFTAAGGVAICERYPIPDNRLLVGPTIGALLEARGRRRRIAERLRAAEESYYRRITPPGLVVVLRVPPEIAVLRKPGEPPDYVLARNRVIWDTDWSASGAHVIDASRPFPEVVSAAKQLVWSQL